LKNADFSRLTPISVKETQNYGTFPSSPKLLHLFLKQFLSEGFYPFAVGKVRAISRRIKCRMHFLQKFLETAKIASG
jgi:hypothetical protein